VSCCCAQSRRSRCAVAFHIAHCEDASGNLLEAKTQYTAILNGNPPDALSATLKACIFRQLGWLYYRVESSSAEQRSADIAQAIQFLNESIQHDPACGKTYYYLGRCYSAVAGRAHDAFVNYRQSIDKAEASADTWCSIGVLYQQQQQPMDAVQAFVCAVQLDPAHTAAWTDLALLYEQYTQFHDALHCYRNALKHNPGAVSFVLYHSHNRCVYRQLGGHSSTRQRS
jgi:histone demethylase